MENKNVVKTENKNAPFSDLNIQKFSLKIPIQKWSSDLTNGSFSRII